MIYLIDDKKNRQEGYSWTKAKFEKYSDFIKPIYTYADIQENNLSVEIFSENNVVLFHESFFDNSLNSGNNNSLAIRKMLDQYTQEKSDFLLAIFSGSKNARKQNNNIIHLPVSTLYQNLEVFIKKAKDGNKNFRHLLFGANPEIEEILTKKLDDGNSNIGSLKLEEKEAINLFIIPEEKNIFRPLNRYIEKTIFSHEIEDYELSVKLNEWLSFDQYDNIFIPLCFGETLSDFNGLRLATQIRCTNTINRLKNIFIYSFVDYSFLITNEYFDILKTKNVKLIEYKREAFQRAVETHLEPLTKNELSTEIEKIKLSPPKNYEDSHSISNEWAIYRWASAIGATDKQIDRITNKISESLYFKYLNTIFPIREIGKVGSDDLKITHYGTSSILYIDDEADKGWYEVLCTIFGDYNNMTDVDYLCKELKSKSREEIIDISIEKLKSRDKYFDLVILDFRLHPDDFNEQDIKNVTGLRLLKAIKKLNPGIQVIIFSATNKVWSLQALQDEGADNFIIKESPTNSVEHSFTKRAIISFLSSIKTALKRKFLKQVFEKCQSIKMQLNKYDFEDDSEYADFLNDLKKQINIIAVSSNRINLRESATLDIVFLNCYNFLEKFKNYYLKEISGQFVLGMDEIEMNRYFYSNGQINSGGYFVRVNSNDNPSWFSVLASLFIDFFSISKINDKEIEYLNRVKDKRNDYIHNLKSMFDQTELLMILSLCQKITSRLKE